MNCDIRQHYRFSPDAPQRGLLAQSGRVGAEVVCFEPGQSLPAHAVLDRVSLYYVIEGTCLFTLNGEQSHVSAGGLVSVPAAVEHSLANAGAARMVLLAVSGPE